MPHLRTAHDAVPFSPPALAGPLRDLEGPVRRAPMRLWLLPPLHVVDALHPQPATLQPMYLWVSQSAHEQPEHEEGDVAERV